MTPQRLAEQAEQTKALLAWMAEGGTPYAFCRRPGTPCVRSIYNWLDKDLVFAEEFRRAKLVGYDVMAQQCLDIADDDTDKSLANVQHRRLQIHTRLQLLARWDTNRYGDKIHVGGDVRVMNDSEAFDQIMSLLATAKGRQMRDPDNRLN